LTYPYKFATLELLFKNKEVAQCVRVIILDNLSSSRRKLYLDAIWNMNCLKRLKLIRTTFDNSTDQKEFIKRICKLESPLEEFSYSDMHVPPQGLPGDDFSISRLSSLTWEASLGTSIFSF
jgi:hypothetical protein